MDPVNLHVVMLFSDKLTKLVFQEVLKKRSVLFKELRDSISKNSEAANAEKPAIENAVKKLQEANLIKERRTSIEDFNTYYVTANGLSAERELRLADPASATL